MEGRRTVFPAGTGRAAPGAAGWAARDPSALARAVSFDGVNWRMTRMARIRRVGARFAAGMAAWTIALGLGAPPAVAQSSGGLLGEYFNNPGAGANPPPPPGHPFGTTFTGSPVLTRIDPVVNFDWGGGTPGAPVNADDFMVVWTGVVTTGASGAYLFGTRADDGTRIWVDGVLVFDNWRDQGPPANPQMGPAITLAASTGYPIRVEFYENGGGAVAQLYWRPPGAAAPAVIPTTNLRPPPPPPAPTLTGMESMDPATRTPRIDLSWTASPNASSYNVKRSNLAGGPYSVLASGVTGTDYADGSVEYDNQYAYVVSGVEKSILEGANSNEVVVTPLRPPPRTNDHPEGAIDDKCSMGSAEAASARLSAAALLLSLLMGGVCRAGRRSRRAPDPPAA